MMNITGSLSIYRPKFRKELSIELGTVRVYYKNHVPSLKSLKKHLSMHKTLLLLTELN